MNRHAAAMHPAPRICEVCELPSCNSNPQQYNLFGSSIGCKYYRRVPTSLNHLNQCTITDHCRRVFTTRNGLIAHAQQAMHVFSFDAKCPCGVIIVDKAHGLDHKHPETKEKCLLRTPPHPVKKIFDETKCYQVPAAQPPTGNPAASNVGVGAPAPPALGVSLSLVASIKNELRSPRLSPPFLTLLPAEIAHFHKVAEDLIALLQGIKIKKKKSMIAKVEKFGSLPKKTAVPGFVDVDLSVSINGYDVTKRAATSERIKSALCRVKDLDFVSSADDILQCFFKGVEFDLVLVCANPASNDERGSTLASGVSDVSLLRSTIECNGFVLDAIRGCKYWLKRHPSCSLKSVLVETIVLHLHQARRDDNAEKLFEAFLCFLREAAYESIANPSNEKLTELVRQYKPSLEIFSAIAKQES
jgi:hypothetical protein